MSLAAGLQQHMPQPGARAQGGIVGDSNLLRDLVCRAKTDARNVLRQGIGVSPDFLDGVLAVGLVNPHRAARAHAVRVQEHHDLADHLLLGPRGLDPPPPFGADPFDFFEPDRIVLDDIKNLPAKFIHHLPGVNRPNALHHPSAEVFLDALRGRRRCAPQQLGAKLPSKFPVLNPPPLRREPFPGIRGSQRPDHRHRLALPADLDPEHREPVLFVKERNPLDQTREALDRRGCLGRAQITHAPRLQGRWGVLVVPAAVFSITATASRLERPPSNRNFASGCVRGAPPWSGRLAQPGRRVVGRCHRGGGRRLQLRRRRRIVHAVQQARTRGADIGIA